MLLDRKQPLSRRATAASIGPISRRRRTESQALDDSLVRADAPSPARSGVILLHGIARTSRSMNAMEKALKASGFRTLNLDYASRKKPLDQLAADIHPTILNFANGLGADLHFVGHSMGGLLVRILRGIARSEHCILPTVFSQRSCRRCPTASSYAEPTACNCFSGCGDGNANEIATAPSATAIEPMKSQR